MNRRGGAPSLRSAGPGARLVAVVWHLSRAIHRRIDPATREAVQGEVGEVRFVSTMNFLEYSPDLAVVEE